MNIYFDGIQDETSKLLGTILIGDIPLPLVYNKGFIYPSIYPYVDFESQEYIYNANLDYFVSNNNPKAQAEIWHGLINFQDNIEEYEAYFAKLRSYQDDPQNYIGTGIWYDDIIGIKKFLQEDKIMYYANNFLFTEDV